MDAEKLLRQRAELVRKAARQTVDSAIGGAALEILRTQDNLTTADLIAYFEQAIAASPSAEGRGHPEQDAERVRAEEAITRLRSLRSGGQ